MRKKLEDGIDEMIPGKSLPMTVSPSLTTSDHSGDPISRRSGFDDRLFIVDGM